MGAADRIAEASGLDGFTLMESAGSAVAVAVGARWPMQSVVVLCGPGKNGGDGLVAARRLLAAGWPVRVAFLGSHESRAGEAGLAAGLLLFSTHPAIIDAPMDSAPGRAARPGAEEERARLRGGTR